VKIVYTRDTTVISKRCKVLQKTQFGYSYLGVYDTVNLGNEFTYLDSTSNIVYRFFDNKFDTLYNFNALIGDKWRVHGMHNTTDSGIVVVDSIGKKIINSDTLQAIFMSTVTGSCIGWSSVEVVERLGCINDYMFPNYISCVADLSEGGPLRCYTDDNFPIYMTGESAHCDFITSIVSYKNINDIIEIYPNPATDNLIIEAPQNAIIEIANIQGQLIKTFTTKSAKTNINVSALPSGVYVVQVKSEKVYKVGRFVKE
jgi:hypothetical protein